MPSTDASTNPPAAPVVHRGVDHVALRAADFDATFAFYRDALGFRPVREWSSAGVVSRAAFLDAGNGVYLELFESAVVVPGGPADPATAVVPALAERSAYNAWPHIALRTDDVDAAYATALAHGATAVLAPTDLDPIDPDGRSLGDFRMAFVAGLDGEVIEFVSHEDFSA